MRNLSLNHLATYDFLLRGAKWHGYNEEDIQDLEEHMLASPKLRTTFN